MLAAPLLTCAAPRVWDLVLRGLVEHYKQCRVHAREILHRWKTRDITRLVMLNMAGKCTKSESIQSLRKSVKFAKCTRVSAIQWPCPNVKSMLRSTLPTTHARQSLISAFFKR